MIYAESKELHRDADPFVEAWPVDPGRLLLAANRAAGFNRVIIRQSFRR